MALGFTNRGKLRAIEAFLQDRVLTGLFVALVTNNAIPDENTNIFSELDEIIAGNGYTPGGQALARSLVGFPTSIEDDGANKGLVIMRDVFFTASGGILPSSGDGVKFMVLTDDNANVSDREVFAFAEFDTPKILPDGQILSILELRYSLT